MRLHHFFYLMRVKLSRLRYALYVFLSTFIILFIWTRESAFIPSPKAMESLDLDLYARESFALQQVQINGLDVSLSIKRFAKGIFMLFHGCQHDAKDWFYLPNEQEIIKHLLSNRYSVIAFSSKQRTMPKCWSNMPGRGNPDIINIEESMDQLKIQFPSLDGLPLYGIGASSGGMFVSTLAAYSKTLHLQGICVQIAPIHPSINISALNQHTKIAFLSMVRDRSTHEMILHSISNLDRARIQIYPLYPSPILSGTFSSRIPFISPSLSEILHSSLISTSLLDSHNLITIDPRRWSGMSSFLSLLDCCAASVQQILNEHFAQHELSSRNISSIETFIAQK